MEAIQEMFPSMDKDIIEAVFGANNEDPERTINALIEMNSQTSSVS